MRDRRVAAADRFKRAAWKRSWVAESQLDCYAPA